MVEMKMTSIGYFQVGTALGSALGRAQEMHDHHSRGRHRERIESVPDLRGPKRPESGFWPTRIELRTAVQLRNT